MEDFANNTEPTAAEVSTSPPDTSGSNSHNSAVDAVDKLTAFYESNGTNQAETEDKAETETVKAEEPVSGEQKEQSKPEPDGKAEKTDSDKPDTEKTTKTDGDEKTDPESEPDEELGEADFDALNKEPDEAREFPDLEALKTKFPRQSKDFYEEAAKLSIEAKKGYEAITALGGDEYLEPLTMISKGIQNGDNQSFFEGVLNIGSTDALLNVTADSVVLSLIKADEWAKNAAASPELAEVGSKMLENVDKALAIRFGEEASLANIETFSGLAKHGWIEALNKWREEGFVDYDEWQELLDGDSSPKEFAALRQKASDTAKQLEEANKQIGQKEQVQETKVEKEFSSTSLENVGKVFSDVVLEKSVLRPLESDSADLKEQKDFLRSRIIADAKTAFAKSPAYSELLTAYKRAEQNSPAFRQKMTKAINNAVLEVKEDTARAETIVKNLYGKTRNSAITLQNPEKDKTSAVVLQPTTTIESESNKPKTQDQIEKELAEKILNLG